ncbi:MAG: hypothetical protein HRT37_07050 [Alteromonadaceae bacterium]|nr:hypothetical protein [Alteromonadaceae bacterium]
MEIAAVEGGIDKAISQLKEAMKKYIVHYNYQKNIRNQKLRAQPCWLEIIAESDSSKRPIS